MTWTLRVATVQMTAGDNVETNLDACVKFGQLAADSGAQLTVFPECFSFLGSRDGERMSIAESLHNGGRTVRAMSELARRTETWVIGGGMPETHENAGMPPYNTAVVWNPKGEIVAAYRKLHLFDVDIPGRATLKESETTTAGSAVTVVDIAGVRVGLSICYDIRFPELYRQLTQAGAEVIAVPAAFTAHTGAAHWHVLQRARAIENQVWIVAPGQTGVHNPKRETFGHSLVVDPWGTVVTDMERAPGVMVTELRGSDVAQRRAQMPCLQHAKLLVRG